MLNQIVIAPDYKKVEEPLIFLAGPITAAYHWQDEAINIIEEKASKFEKSISIASPRQLRASGRDFRPDMQDKQVDWETTYLDISGWTGCILFWLSKEAFPHPEGAYAKTTRVELGEWKERHVHSEYAKLVIGIEEGFSGEDYLRKRIPEDSQTIPILSTLEETCEEAIKICLGRKNGK